MINRLHTIYYRLTEKTPYTAVPQNDLKPKSTSLCHACKKTLKHATNSLNPNNLRDGNFIVRAQCFKLSREQFIRCYNLEGRYIFTAAASNYRRIITRSKTHCAPCAE